MRLENLTRLEPGGVHVIASNLRYRFAITLGREPITLTVVDRIATGADAKISASVATLVDLLEGWIDSDTLFYRRDLRIVGNTAVVVGLSNVLDREQLFIASELEAPWGPLGRPARRLARAS
jgi:predicted lipid carrier protein YhbT